jgi:hypothetical protein
VTLKEKEAHRKRSGGAMIAKSSRTRAGWKLDKTGKVFICLAECLSEFPVSSFEFL